MNKLQLSFAAISLLFTGAARAQVVKTLCDSGCDYKLTEIQRAVDDAQPGWILSINGTAITNNGLILRNKTNPNGEYITLRSANLANLPPDTRVAPGSSDLATLTYAARGYLTMISEPGAAFYRFQGIRFTHFPGDVVVNLIQFGVIRQGRLMDHELSDLPHDIEFDRCVFTGYPGKDGPYRAILANTGRMNITNSTFAEIKGINTEAQAITGWNGTGPFYFRNNRFEASTIDTLFGGAAPNILGVRAKDLYFGGNHYYRSWRWRFTKGTCDPSGACLWDANGGEYYLNYSDTPRFWQCQNGSWNEITEAQMSSTIIQSYKSGAGAPSGNCSFNNQPYKNTTADEPNPYWLCTSPNNWNQTSWGQFALRSFSAFYQKNHFELKNAERALVEGNVIENAWLPAAFSQHGAAFLFNQVDNDNYYGPLGFGDPSAIVAHVVARNNLARNTPWGVSNGTIGSYFYPIGDISIEDNVFSNLGGEPQSLGDAQFIQTGKTGRYRIAYNTVISTRATGGLSVYMQGTGVGPEQQIEMIGNILPYMKQGFYNDNGSANTASAIDRSWLPNRSFSKNVVVDHQGTGNVVKNIKTADPTRLNAFPCPTCAVPRYFENAGTDDVGFVSFNTQDYHLRPDSPYTGQWAHGRPVGADIDSTTWATAGVVEGQPNRFLDFKVRAVLPTDTAVSLRYTAYDQNACSLKVSTRPDLFDPFYAGTDSGGDLDRFVNLINLQPATRYYYAISCGSFRRSGSFLTLVGG
jgi:hypothetical protein